MKIQHKPCLQLIWNDYVNDYENLLKKNKTTVLENKMFPISATETFKKRI